MISKKQLNELSGIQKQCVDLIGPRNEKNKFKANQIPTVKLSIKLEQYKLGYKLINHLLTVGIEKTMTTDHKECSIAKSHRYPTRNKNVPNRPVIKTNLYHKSFLYCAIQQYSDLSQDTKDSKNLIEFVRKCKKSLEIT